MYFSPFALFLIALYRKCKIAAKRKANAMMAFDNSTLLPWNLRITPLEAKHKQAIKAYTRYIGSGFLGGGCPAPFLSCGMGFAPPTATAPGAISAPLLSFFLSSSSSSSTSPLSAYSSLESSSF
jgi:hypothetical protein